MAVHSVVLGLKDAKALKEVAISFYECPKIIGTGIKSIGDFLRLSTLLQNVQLTFSL